MASHFNQPVNKGRGSQLKPQNRFLSTRVEEDFEHFEHVDADEEQSRSVRTEFIPDKSRSIISENNSPDVGFRYSLNPYRGCEHGCAYCYARPTHEYLDLNAGIDFETKIFVKERAPELFRDWLARDRWQPELIAFSGVTDCYQPIEKKFCLTKQCLEVALEARQPISIVTKNALITRDLEILCEMAKQQIIHVTISVTTLDESLARSMEPRTSTPNARLRTIQQLTDAGIPTRVFVAPVIPGLNDSEIPQILEAASEVGADSAYYILLRLPMNVEPVFRDWLERIEPTRKSRVESMIRATREGKLNSSQFGTRMSGCGLMADQIRQTFEIFSRRHGLDTPLPPFEISNFRNLRPASGQLRLF